MAGQGRLRRRRRQLCGPGGAPPGRLRAPRHARRARRRSAPGCREYLAAAARRRQRRGPARNRGDRRWRRRATRAPGTAHGPSGEHETVAADGLFVLIGARPRTDWLPGRSRGTAGIPPHGRRCRRRLAARAPPLPLETSMPGVFARAMSGRIRQAGGLRGRGRLDRHPARPQSLRRRAAEARAARQAGSVPSRIAEEARAGVSLGTPRKRRAVAAHGEHGVQEPRAAVAEVLGDPFVVELHGLEVRPDAPVAGAAVVLARRRTVGVDAAAAGRAVVVAA